MTKDEWDQVEKAVESQFCVTNLTVDGYSLKLILERIGRYELGIAVYIDGEIRGEWIMKDCEERRRFYRRSTRSVLNKKEKDMLKKMSKKRRDEFAKEYNTTYDVYYPYWQSFRALKKHLIDNNNDIQLVSIK